jgi:4,5-DOPA dioxygenase extradiol
MDRRKALQLLAGGSIALGLGATLGPSLVGGGNENTKEMETVRQRGSERMSVGFVGHGAPTLALDAVKGADLAAWREELGTPGAILMISAHWEDAPLTLSSTTPSELVYDFYGFPPPLYRVRHDAPPAAELAKRLEALFPKGEVVRSSRGLDHGAWVPLRHLDPEARIPTLQLSMPATMRPDELLTLGRRQAPLRDEGVWIVGSGNVVHNLRQIDFSDRSPPPMWAMEFDRWVEECLATQDVDALADHRRKGPGSTMAHPTDDHYRPLLVAIGAAEGELSQVSYPVTGFEFGSISRRCISFG